MMTELDLAQSVAEGTTSTPARIGENSWLVMLRISGTGCAFRPAHQEFAFREADVWLSQSMMRRWIGVGTPGRRPTADTGRSARSPETVRSPRNQRPIRQKMTSQKKIKWASSSKLVMLSPTLGACRTGGRELATTCGVSACAWADAIGRISPKHKNVDLPSIGDKRALVNIVDEIFADTAKAARDDTGVQAGTLREVVEVGQSGRRISRFYGSPSTTLAPWMVPVFRVRKIRRNPDRNYDE